MGKRRNHITPTSMMYKTECEMKNHFRHRMQLSEKQQSLVDNVRCIPGYYKDGTRAIVYGSVGYPCILKEEFRKTVNMMFIQADPETKVEATKVLLKTCLNDNCINNILELLF